MFKFFGREPRSSDTSIRFETIAIVKRDSLSEILKVRLLNYSEFIRLDLEIKGLVLTYALYTRRELLKALNNISPNQYGHPTPSSVELTKLIFIKMKKAQYLLIT